MADPISIVLKFDSQGNVQLTQARRSLSAISKELVEMSLRGQSTNRVMNRLQRELNSSFSRLNRSLRGSLTSGINGMDTLIKRATTLSFVLGGAGAYGLRQFSRGMKTVTDEFFRINEQFQGLEISLESVFRSRTVAGQISKQLEIITARSAIPLEQLSQTARGVGILPQLRESILKDAAAGKLQEDDNFIKRTIRLVEQLVAFRPDKNAADAVFSIREALSGEFRSLIRRFDIPISLITRAAGKSRTELKDDPLATLEAMQKAFDEIISDRAIENLVRLPSKLFENLVEQIFSIPLKRIGEQGSFRAIQDRLVDLFEEGQYFASNTLEPLAEKFSNAIIGTVDKLAEVLTRNAEEILGILGVGEKDLPGLSQVERLYQGLFRAFEKISDALPTLIDRLLKFSRVALPLFLSVTDGLLSLFSALAQGFESSPLLTTALLGGAYASPSILRGAVGGVANTITNVGRTAVGTAVEARAAGKGFLGAATTAAGNTLRGNAAAAGGFFLPFGSSIPKVADNAKNVAAAQQAVRRFEQLVAFNKADLPQARKGFETLATADEKKALGSKAGTKGGAFLPVAPARAERGRLQQRLQAEVAIQNGASRGLRTAAFGAAIGSFIGGVATFAAAAAVIAGAAAAIKFFADREARQDKEGRDSILEDTGESLSKAQESGNRIFAVINKLDSAARARNIPIDDQRLDRLTRFASVTRGAPIKLGPTGANLLSAVNTKRSRTTEIEDLGSSFETLEEFEDYTAKRLKDIDLLQKFLRGEEKKIKLETVPRFEVSDAETGLLDNKLIRQVIPKLEQDLKDRQEAVIEFAQKISEQYGLEIDFFRVNPETDKTRAATRDALSKLSALTSTPDLLDDSFANSFGIPNILVQELLAQEIDTTSRQSEKAVRDLEIEQRPFLKLQTAAQDFDATIKKLSATKAKIEQAVAKSFETTNNDISEADRYRNNAVEALDLIKGLAPSLNLSQENSIGEIETLLRNDKGDLNIPDSAIPDIAQRIFKLQQNIQNDRQVQTDLAARLEELTGIGLAESSTEVVSAFSSAISTTLVPRVTSAGTNAEISSLFTDFGDALGYLEQSFSSPAIKDFSKNPELMDQMADNVAGFSRSIEQLSGKFDPNLTGIDLLHQDVAFSEQAVEANNFVLGLLTQMEQAFDVDESTLTKISEAITTFEKFAEFLGLEAKKANELLDVEIKARQDARSERGFFEVVNNFSSFNSRFDSRSLPRLQKDYGNFQKQFDELGGAPLPDIDFSKIPSGENALSQVEAAREMQRILPVVSQRFRDLSHDLSETDYKYEDMADNIDILIERYGRLAESIDGGGNAVKSFGRGVIDQLKTYEAQAANLYQQGSGFIQDFSDTAGNAFANFVTGASSAREALQGFLADLAQSQARAASNKLMQQLLGLATSAIGNAFTSTPAVTTDYTNTEFGDTSYFLNRRGSVIPKYEMGGKLYGEMPMGGKIPYEYDDGGMLVGPSHEEGGIKARTRAGRMIELEGGEVIINRRSSERFRKELSDINVAGGGVSFATGGVSSPTIDSSMGAGNFKMVEINTPVSVNIKVDSNGTVESGGGEAASDTQAQSANMGQMIKAAVKAVIVDQLRHDGMITRAIKSQIQSTR